MIDINGEPLLFAEASYSCAVDEPIISDDCESVKMYVTSGADATASSRAWLRYSIDKRHSIDKRQGKDYEERDFRVTYHLSSHRVVLRHPSLVFPGYRIDEAMIVDDSR